MLHRSKDALGMGMRRIDFRGCPIGSLHDDLFEVAKVAAHFCGHRPRTVWVDHLDVVHIDRPDDVAHAPPDMVVGTYRGSKMIAAIERDLSDMLHQHGLRPLGFRRPSVLLIAAINLVHDRARGDVIKTPRASRRNGIATVS
jgi:hypothetical protein